MAGRKKARKHWTQTPEGRRKLAERSERLEKAKVAEVKGAAGGRQSRRASVKGVQGGTDKTEAATAIAFARCDAWIELYADTFGISRAALASRVGEALQRQGRRG